MSWLTPRLARFLSLAIFGAGLTAAVAYSWDERFIDLGVYRMGGASLLSGADLYTARYEVGGLPFTYTPFAAVAFVPFAAVPVVVAQVLWTGLSIGALWRSCHLLLSELARRQPLPVPLRSASLALAGAALLLEPTMQTIMFGQVNLVIMWAVLEDLLGDQRRGRGVLVGLATGIKLLPGIFVVFTALVGRWRDALRGAATAAGTVAIGLVLVPDQAWRYWTSMAYDSERIGVVSYVSNQSLNGVIWRLTGNEGNRLLWLGLATVTVTTALVAGGALWRQNRRVPAITAVALATLLASPISWTHHWVWAPAVAVSLADPLGPRWLRWTLGLTSLAAVTSWWMWRIPGIDDPNHLYVGSELLSGSLYSFVGVALLAYLVWMAVAGRADGRNPAPQTATVAEAAAGQSPM